MMGAGVLDIEERIWMTRLSALMDLYIHHLKGIFYHSHHKIYSFPHPFILYIILYSL
jgi:hypothetical protein